MNLQRSLPACPALVAVALAVLLIYLSTLAPGLTWANNGADGGDLITAAATLGVAHPTGYPTYLLLAHLFQQLPFGSPAWRTNLFSAAAAASAAGVAGWIVMRCHAGATRYGVWGGAIAAVGLGLSPLLWSQAVIAEVYALQTLLTALIIATALPATRESQAWPLVTGLICGLALGNHLTTLLLFPAWLLVLAWQGGRLSRRPPILALCGTLVAACIYLYVPLRAAAQPAINWGEVHDWESFLWLITGQPYQNLVFRVLPADLWQRVQAWGVQTGGQFGWPLLAVAGYGLFFGGARQARMRFLALWMMATASVFAIGYNTIDWQAYLLPAVLALACWLGLGAAALCERVGRARGVPAATVTAVLLTALLMLNVLRNWPTVDASRDLRAEEFGRKVMAEAPLDSILFTDTDRDTFALWYFRFALGQRPDTAVMVERMLPYAWYRTNLRATFSGIAIPESAPEGDWAAAVMDLNARPWCRTRLDSPRPLVCPP